jgi:hypothetical protein
VAFLLAFFSGDKIEAENGSRYTPKIINIKKAAPKGCLV